MHKKFEDTLGLGDVLFFIALGIGFPTLTFLVLLATSLIFSLLIYLIIKSNLKSKKVPLAGFQALFIFIILFINLMFNIVNIYTV